MVVIRRAKPGDAKRLAGLAERAFRDAFTAANEQADIDFHCANHFGTEIQGREIVDPNCATILAEVDGDLVAFAQVLLRSTKPCVSAERPSELLRFYVSSEWLGRGIAHDVMPAVLATAADEGADVIWLGVWEENLRAIAFYRKYGFEVVGDHEFHLGEDIQRDLVMAVDIEAPSDAWQCAS